MNDYQRMKAGKIFLQPKLYISGDEGGRDEMRRSQLIREANQLGMDLVGASRLMKDALGHLGEGSMVATGFLCDFPSNIFVGDHCFINMDCSMLSPGKITIGNHVMIAPHVRIYTLIHPMTVKARRKGVAMGKPVTICDDAWICGDVIICPGVTIGAGAVIGAGSVVTRDIPAGVFAAGNPCRVIREIGEDEEALWDSLVEEYENDPDVSPSEDALGEFIDKADTLPLKELGE